jgi:regulator of sigma E protease
MSVTIDRNGQSMELTVTPELDPRNGVGSAGWAEQSEIQIGGVSPGKDAEKKGLRRGDILVSVNGQPIRSSFRLRELIRGSEGRPVEVVYSREGKQQSVSVQPSKGENEEGKEMWMIGISMEPRVIITKLGLSEALVESVRTNLRSATLIYQLLRGIIEQRMSPKSLEGPIRIAQLSGDAAREGPMVFLGLMAMVSLNLAVFNLLPIPILDGGVIVMLLLEMIIRRDLSLQFKEAVIKVGFVFLMLLVVFVLYNDIRKIMPAGG